MYYKILGEFLSSQSGILILGGWAVGWVVPRKKFGLNLYQVKSGVISFWVGGWAVRWVGRWSQEKLFGLNLYQAKSSVISFWADAWVGSWVGG